MLVRSISTHVRSHNTITAMMVVMISSYHLVHVSQVQQLTLDRMCQHNAEKHITLATVAIYLKPKWAQFSAFLHMLVSYFIELPSS